MRSSLEAQLVALTLAVALAGVGLHAAVVTDQSIDELRSSLDRDRATKATVAAHNVGEVLRGALADLQAAAASIHQHDLRGDDPHVLVDNLGPLLAGAFASVVLVADDGRVLYAQPPGTDPGLRVPPLQPVLHTGAEGRFSWLVPLTSAPAPPFVVGALKTDTLFDALFSVAGDQDIELTLVDGNGARLIATGTAGADLHSLDEPARTLTASSLVPGAGGWQVTALQSEDALATLQNRLLLTTGAVAITVAGAAVVLGVALARRVARPIQSLSATAVRLRRGEAGTRATPTGAKEVRRLATELNALVDDLERERGRLLHLQEDLERRVHSRTKELARERQALEEFASTVTHDLRAPLRAINLHLELLAEGVGSDAGPQVHNAIRSTRDRIAQLDSMIVGVLEYSRRGRVPVQVEELDVGELLTKILEALQPRAGIKVTWDELPALRGDPVQVQQVLQNLIGNAIAHHDRHAGHVRVSGTSKKDFHVICVDDDGPAVPQEDVPRLFRMFGPGTADTSVSGIGLAVVRRIVESNGGSVHYEPRPERGSRFVFTWPKQPAFEGSGVQPKQAGRGKKLSVRHGRPTRVPTPEQQVVRRKTTSGS